MNQYLIAPSLLSANVAKLGEEALAVLNAGADMLHLDVMDNHYVPNLTFGPLVCQALRKHGITAPIDVHLMARPVDRLIADFAEAGATYITFHPEASDHIDRSLSLIKKHGCKVGLALNPASSLYTLDYIIDKLDMILIMSVNPGFGGQSFIPYTLGKITEAREMINAIKPDILLSVDGGVKVDNIKTIAQAGANAFVAGSAIFDQPDYVAVINNMRRQLA